MKEKPKCPNCGTNEYVVLDNTGKVVGTGTGIAVGGGRQAIVAQRLERRRVLQLALQSCPVSELP